MTIGEKIRYLRTSFQLSQKALAAKSGVSEIAIRKYEAGDRIPRVEQAELLASAFGISYNALTGVGNTSLKLETVGDLVGILMLLCNSEIIKISGNRKEDYFLDPDTVTIQFNPLLASYFNLSSTELPSPNTISMQNVVAKITSPKLLNDLLKWEKMNYLLQTSLSAADDSLSREDSKLLNEIAEYKELVELELQKSQILLDRSNGLAAKICPNTHPSQ